MMKNYILLLFTALFIHSTACCDEWNWWETFGNSGNDSAIKTINDDQDNQYIIGRSDSSINFGDFSLVPEGEYDCFLAKLDPQGSPLWAVRIGGESMDEIKGIDMDKQGNIYVTGSFDLPQATFQSVIGDSVVVSNVGYKDFYVAKYSPQGELLWVYNAGADQDQVCYAYSHSIDVDDFGNVYVAGQFWRFLEIGGELFESEGYGDAFVAKLDPFGNILWAQKINCSYHGRAYHVRTDNEGSVYVSGLFEEEHITFPDTVFYATQWEYDDPAKDENFSTSNNYRFTDEYSSREIKAREEDNGNDGKMIYIPIVEDAFLVKYDSNGEYQWARHISGGQDEQIGDMIIDQDNNLYLGFNWMYDINVGDSTFTASMGGLDITYYNIAVAKFDSEGQFHWAKQEGPDTPMIWVHDLSLNYDNRLFASGTFFQNATFSGNTISATGSMGGYIAMYEENGDFIRTFLIDGQGPTNSQTIKSVSHESDGSTSIYGNFTEDILLNNEVHYSAGAHDLFITSINLEMPPPILDCVGPQNLTAEIVGEYNVELNWDSHPGLMGDATELYYGMPETTGTTTSPEMHFAVGYQIEEAAMLTAIKSYVAPTSNFAQDVTFFVYGDNNGLPDDSNVLGGPYVIEVPGGNLGVALWIQADITPLELPANQLFHIVQQWNMNSMEVGSAKGVPNTHNAVNYMGNWMALSDIGVNQGFILRGVVSSPVPALGYNIYRDGNRINDLMLEETSFTDTFLPNGVYDYHVTALFEAGESQPSAPASVTVDFVDHAGFTVNISTNSGDSPEGAIVRLQNQNGNPDYDYIFYAPENGTTEFSSVYTGWGQEYYTLTINHPSFETWSSSDISITSEGGSIDVTLTEHIANPFNLIVESTEPGQALLTWNNAEVLDEGFETEEFPPAGWLKLSNDGGTGWDVVLAGEAPIGWEGGQVVACPDGGAKMAFATYATGGDHTNDQWLITPQVVVEEDTELSFYLQYLPFFEDYVDIRISTSVQDNAEAFDILVDQLHFDEESSMEWQHYSYNLADYVPAGTPVYIAFREHMEYYPEATPIILLDNVHIGPAEKSAEKALIGYNIYLDDLTNAVATEVSETTYLFEIPEGGDHTAGVQAVYTTGESEIITIDFSVEAVVETYIITFNVDMSYADGFDPENDQVFVSGSFSSWQEPGSGTGQELVRVEDSMIWTINLELEEGNHEYKFYMNPGFEGEEFPQNRSLTVDADATIDHWFGHENDPTGINGQIFSDNLNIYPNPARNFLNISSDETINEIRIVDLAGKMVYHQKPADSRMQIDISFLNEGIYLLQINYDQGIINKKVTIIK